MDRDNKIRILKVSLEFGAGKYSYSLRLNHHAMRYVKRMFSSGLPSLEEVERTISFHLFSLYIYIYVLFITTHVPALECVMYLEEL